MHRHFSGKFKREVVIIHPGEYFASADDLVISTVLGSCIAVAFHDPGRSIGGMNHFMLPAAIRAESFLISDSGKYGMYAMELVINEMLKLGARREQIRAKVFGGGHVLRTHEAHEATIPQSNITFAFNYLETEGIKVVSSDVGGTAARKIFLFPRNFRILLKRITGNLVTEVEKEEEEYLKAIRRRKLEASDEPTLF